MKKNRHLAIIGTFAIALSVLTGVGYYADTEKLVFALIFAPLLLVRVALLLSPIAMMISHLKNVRNRKMVPYNSSVQIHFWGILLMLLGAGIISFSISIIINGHIER